jgi:hypothetical protein
VNLTVSPVEGEDVLRSNAAETEGVTGAAIVFVIVFEGAELPAAFTAIT